MQPSIFHIRVSEHRIAHSTVQSFPMRAGSKSENRSFSVTRARSPSFFFPFLQAFLTTDFSTEFGTLLDW